ncbi:MAG: two component transcriptional regulator, winged helix family [Thermomicrobiales bacterium]|nr:two component transcriptional regulator, winged helix family [Thermomicrobiales bacterium]
MVEHRVAEPTEPNRRSRRILVVEDEPSIAGFVRRGLHFEGYDVDVVPDGPGAMRRLRDSPPDLLVLDVMVPGIDGFEIARRLRAAETAESSPSIPILMLTARDAIADRVTGLRAGADDYLVKPFDSRETMRFADLVVDLAGRTVRRGERDIHLTAREFDLLVLFLRHPEKVLPRSTIMARIWGDNFFGDSNVLEVFIANLRRALEAEGEPRLIQTMRGVGYVLRSATGS